MKINILELLKRDAGKLKLAQKKQQAERKLRAEGYSRKEATRIASIMFR